MTATARLATVTALALAAGSLAVLAPPAARAHEGHAHVTTLEDTVADDGKCSLREALVNVNENSARHSDCGPGRGDDLVSVDVQGVIRLSSPLPPLTDPAGVTLQAQGGRVAIDAGGQARALTLERGAKALVVGVDLRGGSAASGGALANAGSLTLSNATISGSTAERDGGGIENLGTLTLRAVTLHGNTAGGDGGGIANRGTLTAGNVTLSGNRAGGAGGGLATWSQATLVHATVAFNQASAGGGVARRDGTLQLENSLLAQNEAASSPDCAGALVAGGRNLVERQEGCTLMAMAEDAAMNGLGAAIVVVALFGGLLTGAPVRSLARAVLAGAALALVLRGVGMAYSAGAGQPLLAPALALAVHRVAGPADLSPLADYGGPGPLHALGRGSAALDQGDPGACRGGLAGALDARGLIRPQGSGCDLGAYEAPVVGGGDLTLAAGPRARLAWREGVAQTGYRLRHVGEDRVNEHQLPSGARAWADPAPGPVGCYVLEALDGPAPLAVADALCLVGGTGAGRPTLTLRLGQSPIAALTWEPVPGADAYVLATVPVHSGEPSLERMAAGVVADAALNTQGAPHCYLLGVQAGGRVALSDAVCALPGLSSLASAGAEQAAAVARAEAAVREFLAGAPALRARLDEVRAWLAAGEPQR